ncbi:KAP family P-loop NTPase fold protein [Ensifer adhaerens]|uniref:KAP family P-loop NTPase fold protein n=1 Tax=Ensifer adhaerens TaxID=106592 RepID=UPI001F179609|nr:P-loop NTPase fold protein [Ensifer adhaerens]
MTLTAESDRAVDTASADEFGFADIARKLAPSLADAAESDGMVIGIEGPWGSGKTSLLNFLCLELPKLKRSNVHVITLAPWLTGDTVSLVESLTSAIADILEATAPPQKEGFLARSKKKTGEYGEILRKYGSRTGRVLAPIAKVAGVFYPPASVIGEGLGVGAEYLEGLKRNPTDAEVKRLISQKLAAQSQRFLVLIDDLDRLEPHQAVEVIRMVRSVADFPKVAYVMCYDRTVLAHALERGLQVKDGDLYLQKVVQLTFNIPLPEPFDLRLSLREKALAVYQEVNGTVPGKDEAEDLKSAIDREGSGLRTPREIKLVLNAIKFAYRNMADDLYFPDLCRISLIKILNPPLYRWLENYLSLRSVIFTGDAHVDEDETKEIGTDLGVLMPSDSVGSTRSIWNLSTYIPGLQQDEDPQERVFQKVSEHETAEFIERKRLGSPLHYRYYFAMSGPRTVLADDKFNELLKLAGTDQAALAEKLRYYLDAPRPLGQSWFDHILGRMRPPLLNGLNTAQLSGLALSIAQVMDDFLAKDLEIPFGRRSAADIAVNVLGNSIKALRQKDQSKATEVLDQVFGEGHALNWLVGTFFRSELFDHGVVGDRPQPENSWHLTGAELEKYRGVLRTRLSQSAEAHTLDQLPDLSRLLYGWRDLAGIEIPRAWVQTLVPNDDTFLKLLLDMRGWTMSDKIYRPLRKGSVEPFLDWDNVEARLNQIKADNPTSTKAEKIAEIETAIRFGDDDF